MKIYKKHDDSATLSESIIIISNNVKVRNKNDYIKTNDFKMIFAFLQNHAMLNKVIPKLKDNESLFDFPFDTISNRIVPKPMDTELIEEVCLWHHDK